MEVFIHFFVSPLIVAWKLTTQDRTDRVQRYITSGFVIYMIKPTLIVFSCVMFIFAYEVTISIYSLVFDLASSNLNTTYDLMEDSAILGFKSVVIMGAVEGFGSVFIYICGMILAYFLILKGDDLILQKFGYKDDADNGMANQLGEKMQNIAGDKVS